MSVDRPTASVLDLKWEVPGQMPMQALAVQSRSLDTKHDGELQENRKGNYFILSRLWVKRVCSESPACDLALP